MSKKVQTKPEVATTDLAGSPWHVKSLVVYAAALICAADVVFQAFILKELWATATSIILMFFLCAESYGRIHKRKTYLGNAFAPVFSVVVIIIIASGYYFQYAQ